MKVMVTSFKRSHVHTATLSAPNPAAGHHWPTPLLETPRHPQASPGQFLVGSLLLSPASWCTRFCCALQESVSQYDFPVYFPMNNMKRQKDRTLRDGLPRLAGAQYATGDQWGNNSRENEETDPKQKQHTAVDVTGDGSKVWCCKEHYCIGIWNGWSMNQCKLEVVKQVMARMNMDILAISELKWTGMGEFNSDDHYIYYCGQ